MAEEESGPGRPGKYCGLPTEVVRVPARMRGAVDLFVKLNVWRVTGAHGSWEAVVALDGDVPQVGWRRTDAEA